MLAPETAEQLSAGLRAARCPIAGVNLSQLNRVLEHTPEDMTATVQCGMTLRDFQAALAPHHQWVPLDPANAAEITIGDLLAHDLSGPRRLGYGTVREYVIGMRAVLGSGEIIRNGGKVVKNVAGYDLCRLFIGAKNTLAIIVEATFKLRPLPEREVVLQTNCNSLAHARALADKLDEPIALDLHNVNGALTLVAAFAGAREDVEAQESAARAAGLNDPGTFGYEAAVPALRKTSVLPSDTCKHLESVRGTFVARLRNGIIYRQGKEERKVETPRVLMTRVKAAYDPRNILPEYSA